MNVRNVSAITFCFIVACAVFLPSARASDWNQQTKLYFNEAVEVPGGVLPAGTYWFVLQNNLSDRNIVQVFSSDWSKLEATLMTVPTRRWQPTDDTEVELAERPHNKPEALLKWYYPGRFTGHEFVYSSRHENEFLRDGKQLLLAEPVGSRTVVVQPPSS